jgi:hypothetical protein
MKKKLNEIYDGHQKHLFSENSVVIRNGVTNSRNNISDSGIMKTLDEWDQSNLLEKSAVIKKYKYHTPPAPKMKWDDKKRDDDNLDRLGIVVHTIVFIICAMLAVLFTVFITLLPKEILGTIIFCVTFAELYYIAYRFIEDEF